MSDQYMSAVLRTFPGSSAASRAKRAAAIHLLMDQGCTSSSVAQTVRTALGASTKELGLPPFRQLLSEDPCFTIQDAKASEARIVLNKGQLLYAKPQAQQSTQYTDDKPWRQRQDLLSCVHLAFPGDSAASRAKRAAALHLIIHPSHNCSSPVATAVREALGGSTKSFGLPPFRQLLLEDRCFTVHDPLASEAYIHLDKGQLELAAVNSILAAIHSIYPAESKVAETRLRRAGAMFLADLAPACRDKCARVAAAVDAAVGSPGKLGLSMKLREILLADPWFKTTPSPCASEVYLKLDAKLLVQHHLNGLAPPTSPRPAAVAAAPVQVPESSSFPALSQRSSMVPDHESQAVGAGSNNTCACTSSSSTSVWAASGGSTWATVAAGRGAVGVQLPTLEDMGTQHATLGGLPASPHSSSSQGQLLYAKPQAQQSTQYTDDKPWRQHQDLLSCVHLAFPGDSAASRAKRAAALHLISHPSHNCSSPVATAVREALGGSTKSFGLPPFRQLLLEDRCFTVHDPLASEAYIHLDTGQLELAAVNSILAAIHSIYPAESKVAETRLRRAAAMFLADLAPACRDKCARVAAAVDAAVGSPGKLGLSMKLREILLADPWFKTTPSPCASEVYLKLDAKLLVQHHLNGLAPPTSPLPAAVAAAPVQVPESSSFPALSQRSSMVSDHESQAVGAGSNNTCACTSSSSTSAWAASGGSTWATVAAGRGAVGVQLPTLEDMGTQHATLGGLPASPHSSSSQGTVTPAAVFEAALAAFEAAALALMPPAPVAGAAGVDLKFSGPAPSLLT